MGFFWVAWWFGGFGGLGGWWFRRFGGLGVWWQFVCGGS